MAPPDYSLFTDRLNSFKGVSVSAPTARNPKATKTIKWPHPDTYGPTPRRLAAAGFFFKPTEDEPDTCECFCCTRALGGWEEEDSPMEEHYTREEGTCVWAAACCSLERDKVRKGKSTKWVFAMADRNPVHDTRYQARLKTFTDWPFDSVYGSSCTSQSLAAAGFVFSPDVGNLDNTICYYCDRELGGWEAHDVPIELHRTKDNGDCPFLKAYDEAQPAPRSKRHTRTVSASSAPAKPARRGKKTAGTETDAAATDTGDGSDGELPVKLAGRGRPSKAARSRASSRASVRPARQTAAKRAGGSRASSVAPRSRAASVVVDDPSDDEIVPVKTRGGRASKAVKAADEDSMRTPMPSKTAKKKVQQISDGETPSNARRTRAQSQAPTEADSESESVTVPLSKKPGRRASSKPKASTAGKGRASRANSRAGATIDREGSGSDGAESSASRGRASRKQSSTYHSARETSAERTDNEKQSDATSNNNTRRRRTRSMSRQSEAPMHTAADVDVLVRESQARLQAKSKAGSRKTSRAVKGGAETTDATATTTATETEEGEQSSPQKPKPKRGAKKKSTAAAARKAAASRSASEAPSAISDGPELLQSPKRGGEHTPQAKRSSRPRSRTPTLKVPALRRPNENKESFAEWAKVVERTQNIHKYSADAAVSGLLAIQHIGSKNVVNGRIISPLRSPRSPLSPRVNLAQPPAPAAVAKSPAVVKIEDDEDSVVLLSPQKLPESPRPYPAVPSQDVHMASPTRARLPVSPTRLPSPLPRATTPLTSRTNQANSPIRQQQDKAPQTFTLTPRQDVEAAIQALAASPLVARTNTVFDTLTEEQLDMTLEEYIRSQTKRLYDDTKREGERMLKELRDEAARSRLILVDHLKLTAVPVKHLR